MDSPDYTGPSFSSGRIRPDDDQAYLETKPNDLLTLAASMNLTRVLVIGVDGKGNGAYLMSDPSAAKAVFDMEIFKAKLMKEVLGG